MNRTRYNCEIAITGCGWVTPFAWGTLDLVLNALAKKYAKARDDSAFIAVPESIFDDCGNLGAEIKKDKGAAIAAVALTHALDDASLEKDHYPADRVGLVLGSALAGQLGMVQFANEVRAQSARFVSPIHFPQTVGNYVSGALARAWSIRGPNSTVASGNASGLDAVCEAVRLIATDQADVAYAGGTDLLSPDLAAGFGEEERFTSDGACLFVVERTAFAKQRGAPILTSFGELGICTTSGLQEQLAEGHYEIVSGSEPMDEKTILIDRWTGACLGVWGAACLAIAIGALSGMPMPEIGMVTAATAGSSPLRKNAKYGETASALVFTKGDDGVFRTISIQSSA